MKGERGKGDGSSGHRRSSAGAATPPSITIVEGAEEANPAALEDVLELLVKWAIRGARSSPQGGD